jgi:hypothetical protein
MSVATPADPDLDRELQLQPQPIDLTSTNAPTLKLEDEPGFFRPLGPVFLDDHLGCEQRLKIPMRLYLTRMLYFLINSTL